MCSLFWEIVSKSLQNHMLLTLLEYVHISHVTSPRALRCDSCHDTYVNSDWWHALVEPGHDTYAKLYKCMLLEKA